MSVDLETELRIWWLRRNVPAPIVSCADGIDRPRWTPAYVRTIIRSIVIQLRSKR